MKLNDFCELYNTTDKAITAAIRRGVFPKEILSKINKVRYIKASYIVKRFNFKNKVINECHSKYYYLSQEMQDGYISKKLSEKHTEYKEITWKKFIDKDLFSNMECTITNTIIDDKIWKFYRANIK